MLRRFYDKSIPLVHPTRDLQEVLDVLLSIPQSAIAVVDDHNRFLGEISQSAFLSVEGSRDVFSSEEQFGDLKYLLSSELRVASDLMEKHDVCVTPKTSIHDVLRLFILTDVSIIPVLSSDKRVLGVISDVSVLQHFSEVKHGK